MLVTFCPVVFRTVAFCHGLTQGAHEVCLSFRRLLRQNHTNKIHKITQHYIQVKTDKTPQKSITSKYR